MVSVRWTARSRRLSLEETCARAEAGRVVQLEARLMVLEGAVAFRDARLEVLEKRLGEERPRRPYSLVERLRILWLMEYYQIPKRRVKDTFGVARSSVHRWLKAFQEGRVGGRRPAAEPASKTPREIAELIRDIFARSPMWGRHRIAMALWAMGVFLSPTAVRDILLRARPEQPAPAAEATERRRRSSVQITAECPNHTWSLDKTRVYRRGIWPTWVLAASDHFSRKVVAWHLEGSNVGWVVEVLEDAFLRHGAPKHIISDQEGVFVSDMFAALLRRRNVRQRFGAVGRHGSIAVTERLI